MSKVNVAEEAEKRTRETSEDSDDQRDCNSSGDVFQVFVVGTSQLVDADGNSVDFDEFLNWRDEEIQAARFGGASSGVLPQIRMDFERSKEFENHVRDGMRDAVGRLSAL
jgi:hypothetical protein